MEIIRKIEKILASNRGWYLFRGVDPDPEAADQLAICKGCVPWEIHEGEVLRLIGEVVVYRGERQFQFTAAAACMPDDPREDLRYICERTCGIGSKTEAEIWRIHGENFRQLAEGDVKGMRPATVVAFKEQCALFDADYNRAKVFAFLQAHGCTPAMAGKAYETWHGETMVKVAGNPYCLASIPGYGFHRVDCGIRQTFGIGDTDPVRIRAAIEYAIEEAGQDGSTAVDWRAHFARVAALLAGISGEVIVGEIRRAIEQGDLVKYDGGLLALRRDVLNEGEIYQYVVNEPARPAKVKQLDTFAKAAHLEFKPTAEQEDAAIAAAENRFCIINGGAGTGKTSVVKLICSTIGKQVRLCAPTGKAAARLKEATGIQAVTIHRLLGADGDGHFRETSLEDFSVIIDEASMVDSALLAAVCRANPRQLILVGDEAQLPPVGKGQPFHDLIAARPELVKTLTKCHRAKAAIFQAAQAIRSGSIPPRKAESDGETWLISAGRSPEEVQASVVAWAKQGELDPATDLVLCPRNGKKGEAESFQAGTVNALNMALLAVSREQRGMEYSETWEHGDRVINTENLADKEVWNGTTFTVDVTDTDGGVWLRRDVPVMGDHGEECWDVLLTKQEAKALRYAYALTIHKAQGSQYRQAVIVLLARDSFQLDRSLVYTAVTRAKKRCIIMGDYAALTAAISRKATKTTILQQLMRRQDVRL